jgi:hypothetical protein
MFWPAAWLALFFDEAAILEVYSFRVMASLRRRLTPTLGDVGWPR